MTSPTRCPGTSAEHLWLIQNYVDGYAAVRVTRTAAHLTLGVSRETEPP